MELTQRSQKKDFKLHTYMRAHAHSAEDYLGTLVYRINAQGRNFSKINKLAVHRILVRVIVSDLVN